MGSSADNDTSILSVDLLHMLFAQDEIKHFLFLLDSLFLAILRNDTNTFLKSGFPEVQFVDSVTECGGKWSDSTW